MICQLTFTRFIAAFLIVFLHCGSELFTQTPDYAHTLRENFHLGVSYFFVLSGYVIMIAYSNLESINFKTYLTNKLSRIYPTHFLALVLTILVSILSMYLFQFPIFMALKKANSVLTIKNPYIYFTIGFLILLAFSHFVYIYFENPLRKKIKTYLL